MPINRAKVLKTNKRTSMKVPEKIVAVDIGASSGRVILSEVRDGILSLTEIHRFENNLRGDDVFAHQCWNLDFLEAEMRKGLAIARGKGGLASVGVDTWGVDYVLLDDNLERIGPAVSYRDHRTDGMMDTVFSQISRAEIYRRTGIQFLQFNTLYQLAATVRQHPEWLARARHFLMIPDYLHFRLCGVLSNEYTNATTTQLFNLHENDWDADLLKLAGLPKTMMMHPVEAGTIIGEIQALPNETAVKVVAPATHDTGSAVAAAPLETEDETFISSGTWSLMGIESKTPFAGAEALAANVSNEGGVERRYRILKNIMGFWLIQRVRKELGSLDHGGLVTEARDGTPWRSLINPQDARFLNPDNMTAEIRAFCRETGQPVPESAGALSRCIFDSLALSYRQVKEELETLRGRPVDRICIVGGGSQNDLVNQLCADACGVPVTAGPIETTALGNVCVQMIALGQLSNLDEARALVRRSFPLTEYLPRQRVPQAVWDRFQSFSALPALEGQD
jgi:rhamnulokinase